MTIKKKPPNVRMMTMDVDPQWLEEVRGPAKGEGEQGKLVEQAKLGEDATPGKDGKDEKSGKGGRPSGSPPRTMKTMEVDPAWLEEIRNEQAKRNIAPPPLPPSAAAQARPKKKAPPPIPREDSDEAPAKAAPRRSVRPPKR